MDGWMAGWLDGKRWQGDGRWVSLNHHKADEKHKSLQVVDVAVEIMTMMKSAPGFSSSYFSYTKTQTHKNYIYIYNIYIV